jgi:hypothetical protein
MKRICDNSSQRWFLLVFVAIVVGVTIGLAVTLYFENQQRVARDQANQYILKIQPLLNAERRFSNVVIEEFSGYGAVIFRGTVASNLDLSALHEFIRKLPPPGVETKWAVRVSPTAPTASAPTILE